MIHVDLYEKYRTFEPGFSFNFEGALNIISGVNGSGKSQLLEFIKSRQLGSSLRINSSTCIDGVTVQPREIMLKSFKELINTQNLSAATAQTLDNNRNQVWNNYQQHLLNPDAQDLATFTASAIVATKILVKAYGQERFTNKSITYDEVRDVIDASFVWQQDDVFVNRVGEMFIAHCFKVRDLKIRGLERMQEATKQGTEITNKNFDAYIEYAGVAPWEELNELFRELKFGYRFRNDYEISRNSDINYQPQIYEINAEGKADLSLPRSLGELSEGEKAIISLCFASIAPKEEENYKLLLLDEYDAALNPSLIASLFRVLQKYFVDKNIPVIFVTHSPATISLSPEYAVFYEVFSKRVNPSRILKANREDYAEMRVANDWFYRQIEDQEMRYKILESLDKLHQEDFAKIEAEVKKKGAPIILTEGFTDVLHLTKALDMLGDPLLSEVQFFIQDNDANKLSSSELKARLQALSSIGAGRVVIGIFDRDEPSIIREIGDLKDYGNSIYGFCLPVISGRDNENLPIEFYYSDQDLTKEKDGRRIMFSHEIDFMSRDDEGNFKLASPLKAFTSKDLKIYNVSWGFKNAPYALSKSEFATLVHDDEDFSNNINFSNFTLVADKIREILGLSLTEAS